MSNIYGTLLSSVTVGAGGAANITFSSIPQTYTDLIIVISARSNQATTGDDLYITINGDTTTGGIWLYGNGSATGSQSLGSRIGVIPGSSVTASTFGNTSIYIPNYAGSTTKSISTDSVNENNATLAQQIITASNWPLTAAITSILLKPSAGVFVQYSTAYLYGLTKGSGGATVS